MPVIERITWITALAVLLSVMWIVVISWKNGISPMPSSKAVRLAVAGEVNRITGYGNIIEAGSGWGTLGLDLIRRCPGKRLTGLENSSLPLWFSQLLVVLFTRFLPAPGRGAALRNRVCFRRGDIYQSFYGDADIVLCYLFPGAMERLAEKFKQELPRGAVVISICFALPGRLPVRTITCRDNLRTKVYVYTF
ncbi:class I SAM-dependent methyltransferase [Paenibacillus albidus]|uniref:class I SAM-dependent methyltransferase n=1 Tax=Paenibacillus albidus TaxID=2041023 RepID=UPI001BE6727A|nr:class I SAM-dependent methyltransferase [Paenibacillus albidus]MBT2291396.1 class I SAM-dependent methyltransferase [Paenibacillus albidus]